MLLWGFSKTSRDEFINVIVAWKEHNKFLHERNESFYTLKVSERGPKERGNVFKVSILSKKKSPFFPQFENYRKIVNALSCFLPIINYRTKIYQNQMYEIKSGKRITNFPSISKTEEKKG